MNKNKSVKLYNVLFPFWMLMLIPTCWLVVLPGNFLIDSIVLFVSMVALKLNDKKMFYKHHILKIYGFGLLADIIGSAYMFLMVICGVGTMGDDWYITIPALLIASVLIYVFNYHISFKKVDLESRKRLALIFAIATAPYTFMIPSSWLYQF